MLRSASKELEKQTKWLNPDDHQQCDWAHKYLRKRGLLTSPPINAPYQEVLAVLGRAGSKLLESMKAADAKRRSRENIRGKGYIEHSLPMKEPIKRKLDSLAHKQDLKTHEALEALILDEYKAEHERRLAAKKEREIAKSTGIYSKSIGALTHNTNLIKLNHTLQEKNNLLSELNIGLQKLLTDSPSIPQFQIPHPDSSHSETTQGRQLDLFATTRHP